MASQFRRAVLGADLGGNNLRMALVSEGGCVLGRFRRATAAERSVEGVLSAVAEGVRALTAGAPVAFALGLGVPGLVDSLRGVVVESPNFPSWRSVPLKSALEARLGIRVHLENDVNAAVIGEVHDGAARGARDVLMVTLGTGVGGGLVLDGRLRRGPDGTAGEVGHLTVRPGGRPCGCGNRGCLESYSSATSIVNRARELGIEGAERGAEGVAERARTGDPRARRVFAEAARCLGIALAGAANLLNLERVIVGGGVARSWDLLEPTVVREVRRRAFRLPADRLTITPTALFDDAGVLGAARLAREAVTSCP